MRFKFIQSNLWLPLSYFIKVPASSLMVHCGAQCLLFLSFLCYIQIFCLFEGQRCFVLDSHFMQCAKLVFFIFSRIPQTHQSYLSYKTTCLPYMRHYNPRFVYFLPRLWRPFLCFQGGAFQKILSLYIFSIQERFLIKSGLWWRAYGILFWFMKFDETVNSF